MSQPNDDLLDRAVSGDKAALVELLNRHAPAVRRSLGTVPERWRSMVSEDDIMQETYITVFENITGFRSREVGVFEGWVAKLAKNNLAQVIRSLRAKIRGGNRVRLNPELNSEAGGDIYLNLFESLGGTTTTPTQAARREEAKAAIHRALEDLDDVSRRVVELYDIECRPAQEVADTLGCSLGAMFMRRKRAIDKLRDLLGTRSNYM